MYYYYILIKFKLTKLEWTVRSWGGGAMRDVDGDLGVRYIYITVVVCDVTEAWEKNIWVPDKERIPKEHSTCKPHTHKTHNTTILDPLDLLPQARDIFPFLTRAIAHLLPSPCPLSFLDNWLSLYFKSWGN